MNKDFVNRYLMENGKYFPSSKLNVLGRILEDSTASEYVINKRFFNPLLSAVISLFLIGFVNPFDRLILRDWFWGILKLIFPIVLIVVFIQKPELEKSFLHFDMIFTALALLYFLWLVIDVFTLYWRVKWANYKSVLRALNVDDGEYISRLKKGSRNELTSSNLTKSSLKNNFEEWREKNPTGTINDFYRHNGR